MTDGAPLAAAHWNTLTHAYGAADDIPAMLDELSNFPPEGAEPWESLWSALCHQGDVYSASFAATPRIVEALSRAPVEASDSYFHLPTMIEVCRHDRGFEAPEQLHEAYFAAIRRLGEVAAEVATMPGAAADLPVVLAAVAVARGEYGLAKVLTELNETNTDIILKMFENGEI